MIHSNYGIRLFFSSHLLFGSDWIQSFGQVGFCFIFSLPTHSENAVILSVQLDWFVWGIRFCRYISCGWYNRFCTSGDMVELELERKQFKFWLESKSIISTPACSQKCILSMRYAFSRLNASLLDVFTWFHVVMLFLFFSFSSSFISFAFRLWKSLLLSSIISSHYERNRWDAIFIFFCCSVSVSNLDCLTT